MIFRRFIFAYAMRFGMRPSLFRRLTGPTGYEYADFLRKHGGFRAIGKNVSINAESDISIPALVSIGDNVRFAKCTLLCHGGEVNMINRAYGLRLDKVGKIEIGDDVFIGHGATIMPNVVIGSRCIVAAGAVVTRDMPSGVVVGGVPARVIGSLDEMVARLREINEAYPWRDLIEQRAADYDAEMEPMLNRMRAEYFYGPSREPRPLSESRVAAIGDPDAEPAPPRGGGSREGAGHRTGSGKSR